MERSSPKHRSWQPQTVVLGLVMALAFALPLAVGGVHDWAIYLTGLACCLAYLFSSFDTYRRQSRLLVSGFGFVLLFMVSFTVLQSIPLPAFLVEVLSPAVAGHYESTAAFLGVESGLVPLSLHPVQSLIDAVRLLSVFLIFVVVMNLVRHREALGEHFLETVAISGLLVLSIGAIQTLLGTGILFGAYEPGGIKLERLFVTTFVNENHVAGLFNLTGLTALGVAHSSERQRKRFFYSAIFVGCMLGTLLSLSRGGIVVAVMSCVLYGTLQSRLRKPYPKRSGKSFGIVVILLLFTLGAGLGYELLSVELGSLVGLGAGAPDLKLESWSRIVEVVRQYPLMGVGSGAFGDVFAGVNDLRPGVEFSHVENLPLQLVVDYGVPVALMILGASCFFLLPSLKTSVRDEDSIGAFAGLYAVFVQNFVDFSLGILGVAIPATIVLAVLVGRRANETRDAIRFRSVPNRLAWPLAMTGVLLLVWAGWNQEQFGDDAVDETMQARVQAASVSTDSEFSVSPDPWAMEVAMKRPMDSHFFLQQGIYYSMVGNLEEGIRWINASIERNPRTYGARLILAQTLLASEKEDESAQIYQALLEDYWEQRGKIFADIATRSQNADFFEKCLPRHETSVRDAVYWLKTQRRKGWAYALLNERVQLQPNDYALRYQLGLLLMESQTLVEEASIQASQLMARHPGQVGGYLLQGHLYEREEKWPESLAMFIEACRMDPQDGDAALGKARLLAMMGKYDEMREVIGALRPQLVGNTVKLARMHAILSTASEGEGRLGEAVLSMEMATALRNNHAPSYVRLGNLYLQISDRTKGRSAFEQALLLEPDNAAATRALEEMDSLETR